MDNAPSCAATKRVSLTRQGEATTYLDQILGHVPVAGLNGQRQRKLEALVQHIDKLVLHAMSGRVLGEQDLQETLPLHSSARGSNQMDDAVAAARDLRT